MAQENLSDNIEKLLEIAEASKEPVKFDDNEVIRYIIAHSIQSGEKRIQTYIIYYHYWNQLKNKRNKMSRRAFFLKFKKQFISVQTSDGSGYLLDPEPFDLSTTGFFQARALLRRERDGRKKEKS